MYLTVSGNECLLVVVITWESVEKTYIVGEVVVVVPAVVVVVPLTADDELLAIFRAVCLTALAVEGALSRFSILFLFEAAVNVGLV